MDQNRAPIYLVDDDEVALALYKTVLEHNGLKDLVLCQDGREVLQRMADSGCALIVLDLHMPEIKGQEILKQVKTDYPDVPVVVVTADEAVDTAVECMKLGAFDYLTKPVEKQRLWAVVRHALELADLQREVGRLSSRIMSGKLSNPEAFSGILTDSESMKAIFRYVEAIAASPRPVLVTGESGTGKELISRVIHSLSGRAGKFVAVNV